MQGHNKTYKMLQKYEYVYICVYIYLSIMQVTICANMKGMKIKPGSLGKAVPPYNVQVC